MPAKTTARPISSMTGFARIDGGSGSLTWTLEAKSVNGRALDIRCRAPSGHDWIELAARQAAQTRMSRGSINVNLQIQRATAAASIKINRALIDELRALAREIDGPDAQPPRLETLLAVRGVVEAADDDGVADDRETIEKALRGDLDRLIGALIDARLSEGARLDALVRGHLAEITRLVEEAAKLDSMRPEAARERLLALVGSLIDAVPPLSEERLTQEVALLMVKADVREELDRLRAHLKAADELLAEGAAIGRKFDFLCQEFNREANTLCSKAADGALTRIGLALKAVIDQLREQVQNVE